jgi:hypothetical protein
MQIAMPGEDLPTAATAAIGGDDAPYEVEVVVDFGVAAVEYPTLTASTIGAHNAATGRTNSTNATSAAVPAAPLTLSPSQSQPKADPAGALTRHSVGSFIFLFCTR